jgi:Arc/MetJ-type ribon-helix-helix transcriptional regulator
MAVEIPAEFQSFVREQLQLGSYHSEQQLVTEALQLLKADRDESLAGIQQGLADAAAGHMQPLAESFADLRREFNSVAVPQMGTPSPAREPSPAR